MIAAIMGRISEAVTAGGWRGCPFLNAAAEYPDPASPVRQAIDARRAWYHDSLRKLLAADGDPAHGQSAQRQTTARVAAPFALVGIGTDGHTHQR